MDFSPVHWLVYASIMFVSSVTYYLLVRKIQQLGVGRKIYMVANYLLPACVYLVLILIKGSSFFGHPETIVIAFFMGAIINYLGSIWGYQGIQTAPNTGYSVIIQKSYAIYTSIAAVLLWGSELTLPKFIAILVIIGFTGLVVIEKQQKGSSKKLLGPWVFYSIGSLFMFGTTALASKYVSLQGADVTVYLFWVISFTATLSIIELLRDKAVRIIDVSRKQLSFLILMAIAVSIFYLSKIFSDTSTPNVGYSSAINTSSNAALTIAAAVVFKEELKTRKLIGVLGVVGGLLLLILG